MYVCICNEVTDREIRRAVNNGADCVVELRDQLGVASCCGQCAGHAQEIIDESASESRADFLVDPFPA